MQLLTGSPLVVRVLAGKAGNPRTPVGKRQLLAAVRQSKHVELAEANLALPEPLATLGEHVVPLRFDQRLPGSHSLTVLLNKRL